MKKFIVGFLGLSSLVISALLIYVAIQPDQYRVERSVLIQATPASLFQKVVDLKEWDSWSPYKELDPNAKVEISDPPAGKGARMTWSGNEQVGEGSMTIVKAIPDEKVVLEQVFVKPMQGKALLVFEFVPAPAGPNAGTKATWRVEGTHDNFVSKGLCTFMNLDAMLGARLEEGLTKMKWHAEKDPEKTPW